jgi:hypothetical protein
MEVGFQSTPSKIWIAACMSHATDWRITSAYGDTVRVKLQVKELLSCQVEMNLRPERAPRCHQQQKNGR